MTYVKAEDLAAGNWEFILERAGLDPAYFRRIEGPCPICGGNQRYRWRPNKESGFCNQCRFLSGFDLLRHQLGCESFKEAADYVRAVLGQGGEQSKVRVNPTPRPAFHKGMDEDEVNKLKLKYRTLWNEGLQIEEGTASHAYLHSRVQSIKAIPKTLRHHPGLPYWSMDHDGQYRKVGDFPAMIAAAQGMDGRVVNIWRTFLDDKGGKAQVDCPKKAAGPFLPSESFAVRLAEVKGDELGVAEGIETALAATAIFGVPCWAVLNAGGLAKFQIPQGFEHVKKLRIFGDNDAKDSMGRRAGNDAAMALKSSAHAKGLSATIILPRGTKYDFADMVK